MSEYGMTLEQVLELKKKKFFWLHNQAERLQAERDMRMLRVLRAAESTAEGFEAVTKSLEMEMGVIYEFGTAPKKVVVTPEGLDPEFDREGLRRLKARHGV